MNSRYAGISSSSLREDDTRSKRALTLVRQMQNTARRQPVLVAVCSVALLLALLYIGGAFDEPSGRRSRTRAAATVFSAAPSAAAAPPPPPVAPRVEEAPPRKLEFAEPPPAPPAVPAPVVAAVAPSVGRRRNVVLYSANGKINTGVWPAWGGEGDRSPPVRSVLNWAAAGTEVLKSCPVECLFMHDDNQLATADAVIIEANNWPKFGLAATAMPLPARDRPNGHVGAGSPGVPLHLPARAFFGMEPASAFAPYRLSDAEPGQYDFSLTQSGETTLPITLVCPWGHAVADFLRPPPAKGNGRLAAYFSEHGVAPSARAFLDEVFAAAGDALHAFTHKRNRATPDEAGGNPFALSNRVNFMGSYRFLLVSEAVDEPDWLSPEWSQALLAGTVPVYIGGPPNLAEFALPGGYVDARRFKTGAELWSYLASFDAGTPGDAAYARFFDWKKGAATARAEDEPGTDGAPLGTGVGVARGACSAESVKAVSEWPLPTHSDATPAEGLDAAAAAGWRCFRRALDRCVHYAECRVCQHVHQVTA